MSGICIRIYKNRYEIERMKISSIVTSNLRLQQYSENDNLHQLILHPSYSLH